MEIGQLTDRELINLENNYVAKALTTGGRFSLAEVRLEKLRRLPSQLDTVALAKRIVELARQSPDGLTTYGELWKSFHPDAEWKGNATQQILANALGRVVAYCVSEGLPIVTVLVVRTGSRKLSEEAIDNIYEEAVSLGVNAGNSAEEFVAQQTQLAMRLVEFPEMDSD